MVALLYIRGDVVRQTVLLEEGVQTVFGYHEQIGGHVELVIRVAPVYHLRQRQTCCVQRIVLMIINNLVNGECELCEDTCRTLDIGTAVVADQTLNRPLVVGDTGGLQHLFRS